MGLEAIRNKVFASNFKLTPDEKIEFQSVYDEVRLSNNKRTKVLDWTCAGCVSTAYTVVRNYWNKNEVPVEIPKASANVKTVTISDADDSGVERIEFTKNPLREGVSFSEPQKKPGRKPKK